MARPDTPNTSPVCSKQAEKVSAVLSQDNMFTIWVVGERSESGIDQMVVNFLDDRQQKRHRKNRNALTITVFEQCWHKPIEESSKFGRVEVSIDAGLALRQVVNSMQKQERKGRYKDETCMSGEGVSAKTRNGDNANKRRKHSSRSKKQHD